MQLNISRMPAPFVNVMRTYVLAGHAKPSDASLEEVNLRQLQAVVMRDKPVVLEGKSSQPELGLVTAIIKASQRDVINSSTPHYFTAANFLWGKRTGVLSVDKPHLEFFTAQLVLGHQMSFSVARYLDLPFPFSTVILFPIISQLVVELKREPTIEEVIQAYEAAQISDVPLNFDNL